jgi:hypothetical protein
MIDVTTDRGMSFGAKDDGGYVPRYKLKRTDSLATLMCRWTSISLFILSCCAVNEFHIAGNEVGNWMLMGVMNRI